MAQQTMRARQRDVFIDGSLALQIERQRQVGREQTQRRAPRDRFADSAWEESTRRRQHEHERRRRMESQRLATEAAMNRELRMERERQSKLEAQRKSHGKKQRITAVALLGIMLMFGVFFIILSRNANIERLIVEQNKIKGEIKTTTQKIGEMEVRLSSQLNIADVSEYARTTLGMDYPSAENTRLLAASK